MSRVLVTGARGLLGGALAARLAAEGFDVLATGRSPGTGAAPIAYQTCELSDRADVAKLFAGDVDAVIHAAARIRGQDDTAFERDNVFATGNLAEAAGAVRIRRFVLISTISVYSGDGPFGEDSPTDARDAYGRTKRAAERVCLETAPSAVVLRLSGLHGAPRRDGVVHEFFAKARRGGPIDVAEPETLVTLTFIDDVVSAVIRLLQPEAPRGRIYNLATREAPSYRALAERVCAVLSSASAIVSPRNPRRRNRVLDTARIRHELGLAPLSLDQHLARFAEATVPARA